MIVCHTVDELRNKIKQVCKAGASIGLVPTMGALHEGHAALIKAAVENNDFVVVTIFVNPTQFGPTEDLDSYPRTLDADLSLAKQLGASLVFAPSAQAMYPSEEMTWVEVTGNLTKVLCGSSRPTHFRGVATIVSKLFNLVKPTRAYFGQKDAQQVQVLKRMVKDLFFDVELVIMPIIREADGLAKSSRNAYLSKEERQAALVLGRSLEKAQEQFKQGERKAKAFIDFVSGEIAKERLAKIDYVAVYQLPDLKQPSAIINGQSLLAVAVYFGQTRLIDNCILEER
ncbi:MAG TPA: pantoate--beta-alanine ligase [Candidatus Avacidaminococcus intestinavium]|uniref:Pantothenate synthetase n=1 Tax=Candidatus Avacidaminococcus intestinavium TaxID=2840684 RepID=A0A9D1MNY6_9FIRM|nr:pantoate--beta-alanine ligase [Candidatus Avacidaminococcus intestinavium]